MNKMIFQTKIPFIKLVLFVPFIFSFSVWAQSNQDLVVSSSNGFFLVKNSINKKEIYHSETADDAIQWAINNAGLHGIAGEVLIEAGSYPLKRGIVVGSNRWVHGVGDDTYLYTDAGVMQAILIQNASMTTVSNMKLENKNNKLKNTAGVVVERSINSEVYEMNITGFKDGIQNLEESALINLSENKLSQNSVNINIQDGGGIIARWLPLTIGRNTIRGGEIGINCNALVTTIWENEISDVTGRGIVANHNSIVVMGNKLSNIGGDYAIYGNRAEFNCTRNEIVNATGGGIRTRCRWGTISLNSILNYGKSGDSYGIYIYSDPPETLTGDGPAESKVIFGNTIITKDGSYRPKVGIREDGLKNLIYKNEIKGCSEDEVLSEGEGSIVRNK